ncbi:MAG: type II toxin-antitoxin system RelE/ParE family toxin [Bacteroidetes bacterium]|nr:type II toxin-antitoxin system RelE/ParE family toxin [Bacteroidota bacterium]
MKSGLKIRWTDEAAKNLEGIVSHLESNVTLKERRKFFVKFEKQLYLLSVFPEAYPTSEKKEHVHRCVFSKDLTIYYSVTEDHLTLLSLFDTRQDPEKLRI